MSNVPEYTAVIRQIGQTGLTTNVNAMSLQLAAVTTFLNAQTGEVVPAPAAPTGGIVNDVANTFTFTLTPFFAVTEHEYSLDNGATYTTFAGPNPVVLVGNTAKAIGAVRVRVKASGTRPAGLVLSNATAFTASAQAPVVTAVPLSAFSDNQRTGPNGIPTAFSQLEPFTSPGGNIKLTFRNNYSPYDFLSAAAYRINGGAWVLVPVPVGTTADPTTTVVDLGTVPQGQTVAVRNGAANYGAGTVLTSITATDAIALPDPTPPGRMIALVTDSIYEQVPGGVAPTQSASQVFRDHASVGGAGIRVTTDCLGGSTFSQRLSNFAGGLNAGAIAAGVAFAAKNTNGTEASLLVECLGHNDAYIAGVWPSADDYEQALANFYDAYHAQRPDVPVVLVTPTYTTTPGVEAYRQAKRNVQATRVGWMWLLEGTDYTTAEDIVDFTHLSVAGSAKLGNGIVPDLLAILEQAPLAVNAGPVAFRDVASNLEADGNNLEMIAGNGGPLFSGRARGTAGIAAGDSGFVEFTLPTVAADIFVGLSSGPMSTGFQDLKYTFYRSAKGPSDDAAFIYESGTQINTGGPIVPVVPPNSVFRVEVTGSTIVYRMNGSVIRTVANVPPGLYYPVVAMNNLGDAVTGAHIESTGPLVTY